MDGILTAPRGDGPGQAEIPKADASWVVGLPLSLEDCRVCVGGRAGTSPALAAKANKNLLSWGILWGWLSGQAGSLAR